MTNPAPMEQSKLHNYNSERGATAYKSDYETKLHRKYSDRRERRIFERYFAKLGKVESLLDLPCGAGRLCGLFQQHAGRVVEADWSMTMLQLNRDDHDQAANGYVRASGLEIPFADRSFDTVVSVRLSHHIAYPAGREQHLNQLFRVADRAVIVTWFSESSLKNRMRQLRRPFNKKAPKHTLANSRVAAIASECGFDAIEMAPLARLGSGHVFGLFRRRTS